MKTVALILILSSGANVWSTGVARRNLGSEFRDYSPFAHNQGTLAGAALVIDLTELRYAWKLKKEGKPRWWLMPVLTSAGHLFATGHNLGLHKHTTL